MNEKYPKELIGSIAESIDCGMTCFVNTETFEMEDVPALLVDDPEEFEGLVGETSESMGLKYPIWKNFIRIEPITSHESFMIMEDFTAAMPNSEMKQQLAEALRHRKPFANFQHIIHNSEIRQDWFDFKKAYLEKYVKDLLEDELYSDEELDFEEANGFFDGEGHKIDPNSVPIRSLCVVCKKHHTGDLEDSQFCLMTRFDQRDEEEFNCDAFEKM